MVQKEMGKEEFFSAKRWAKRSSFGQRDGQRGDILLYLFCHCYFSVTAEIYLKCTQCGQVKKNPT